MFYSKKNIFLQETEANPNRYASYVLSFTLGGILFCWFLTEVGIFHVGLKAMRIGSLVSFVVCLLPLLLMRLNRELRYNPKLKYFIMGAASVFTFTVTTLLSFHATLFLLYPICVAMLYRSKPLGIMALSASVLCTLLSPVLGYILGAWDVAFLQELITVGSGGTVEIIGATYVWSWRGVGEILLYLVVPHTIVVGAFSALMFYVIREGSAHVENQILLSEYSRRDSLTGLFNRNSYQDLLSHRGENVSVAVIFFDVNDLKSANDSRGHEYGDLLLQRCAKSLLDVSDEETIGAFRMGGDEFMLLCVEIGETEIQTLLKRVQSALDEINRKNRSVGDDMVCSMAVGWRVGSLLNLEELVHSADEQMYRNKMRMKKAQ